MANPLFGFFNNGMSNNPFGNISNLVNQFNNFKNTFSGDPRLQIQNLLNSGQMSQQQFEQLKQMANQFQRFLKK